MNKLLERLAATPAWRTFGIVLAAVLGIHLIVLVIFVSCNSRIPVEQLPADAGQPGRETETKTPHTPGPPGILPLPLDYTKAIKGDLNNWYESKQVQSGILLEIDNRRVLWEKAADQPVPIGPIARLMTLLLTFEAIDGGSLTLDDTIGVTSAATQIGGTKVYLKVGESFPLRDLIKSAAIRGANDSTYLIACSQTDGDEEKFVEKMNFRAEDLKMVNTKFLNSHGLPVSGKESVSTAADLAVLAAQLLKYPQLLEWTGTKRDYFRAENNPARQTMTNFNNLVADGLPGVDGLATGKSNLTGYNVVFSCTRNGRRFVGAVMGVPDYKDRDKFVKKLLEWAEKQ